MSDTEMTLEEALADLDAWAAQILSGKNVIRTVAKTIRAALAEKDAQLTALARQLARRVEEMEKMLSKVSEGLRVVPLESGVCCCGGAIDKHGFGDGHAPVDSGAYYVNGLVEEIDALIKTAAAGGEEVGGE